MKIEVAESLFLSWLRHVQGCRISQLNWKASNTWDATNAPSVELLFERSRVLFESLGIDVYKNTRSASQLLKQAEIDAIGICEIDERPCVIAVDVAFHEGGLNYGTRKVTTASVLKKILRTLFALESYFAEYSREIIFATPKLNNAQLESITEAMQALDGFLEENEISAECRVIANAEFFSEIVEPVSRLSTQVADTGELFMRSMQLIRMAPASQPSSGKEQPIGKLVRENFERLFEQRELSDGQLAQLCTEEYSKSAFGLRYAVLKQSTDSQDRFDDDGHARYYSRVFADEYLLCNDWYERNRVRFIRWLRSLERESHSRGE